jgi:hypothetical protein
VGGVGEERRSLPPTLIEVNTLPAAHASEMVAVPARARYGGPAMRTRSVLAGALLALVAGPAVAAAYEIAPVPDGGSLRGMVRFAGPPPRLQSIAVNKNRDVCGDTKESEALVVEPDRGVRGTVVLIEGVARGKKPEHEVLIENAHCRFVPHVSAVMAGARARVKNADPVLHNTHGLLAVKGVQGRITVFNLALPNRDQVIDITKRLTRAGPVHVLCDAHTHMAAWLYVHDSPYLAVTDEAGRYRIDGIPPGQYTVTMWHEGFTPKGKDKDGRPVYDEPRSITRGVTIAPSGTATLDFELK